MREHQIVINLKPDQFEEVQRMARAAGSKSVGLFVRQKLISTLGLGTIRTGTNDGSEAPDLKHLTSELRRLHRELQIFVADSLSNSDYSTPSLEAIPFPTAVQENFLAEGAPLMPESMNYVPENISLPFSQAQLPYSIPQAPPEQIQVQSPYATPSYSIPEAPPEDIRAQPAATQAPFTAPQGFAEDDELEDLAERAFAISPRLGQLDEAVKSFPDPLKDLLDDALLNGVEDEEDYPYEEAASEALPLEEQVNVEKFESAQPETEETEDEPEGSLANAQVEPETEAGSEEQGSDEDEPQAAPPEIPPPISGGPPPRKRPT